jgi:hypothetical protein
MIIHDSAFQLTNTGCLLLSSGSSQHAYDPYDNDAHSEADNRATLGTMWW